MNAPVTRRALLGATAAVGAVTVAGATAIVVPIVADVAVLPRTAHRAPDAKLVLLARRVEALAVRLRQVEDRCSTLEDRVFLARRPGPPLPPEPPLGIVVEHRNTATERVMVVREPLVVSPARAEWRRMRNAAKAAEDSRAAVLAERIGLPRLTSRRDRMRRRLDRWTRQLATTEAATAAGVSAKARVLMAIGGGQRCGIEDAMQDYPALVLSILAAVGTWGQA